MKVNLTGEFRNAPDKYAWWPLYKSLEIGEAAVFTLPSKSATTPLTAPTTKSDLTKLSRNISVE